MRELHALLREGKINKIYWTLTKGKWEKNELKVDKPLYKKYEDGGKHVVVVDPEGKEAVSIFEPIKIYKEASLMQVKLLTGRTHQIRVHAQSAGHPIAMDERYGELDFNKSMRKLGLKRLFLHATSIDFTLPSTGQTIKVAAPLDTDLKNIIEIFDKIKK